MLEPYAEYEGTTADATSSAIDHRLTDGAIYCGFKEMASAHGHKR